MTRTILPLVFLLVILLAGCDATGANDSGGPAARAVYVANQGNFGDGNGSISVYDPETDVVQPAAISSLGSIIQSVALSGGKLYVMSNSGNRIDVFDAETLEQVAQISDVVSPRYLVADGTTGYVTNLYGAAGSFTGGKVSVIDLTSNTVVDEIVVDNNPEGMALVGNRLYVANHGFGSGKTLHVIDTREHAVVDTIDVECDGPRFVLADADDDVFVFCTGRTIYDDDFNPVDETDGAVRILEGTTGEILRRIAVDGRIGTAGPGQDAFFASGSAEMYAVKDENTILVFDTDGNELLGTLGPLDEEPIGAVAYDDRENRLYLGRTSGFTEAGAVSIHDELGSEMHRFSVGVAPSYILFRTADE